MKARPTWDGKPPARRYRTDGKCSRPGCQAKRRQGGYYCPTHHAEHMRRLRAAKTTPKKKVG